MEWESTRRKTTHTTRTRIRDRTNISLTGTEPRTFRFLLLSFASPTVLVICHLLFIPMIDDSIRFEWMNHHSHLSRRCRRIIDWFESIDSSRLVSPLTSRSKLRPVSFYPLISHNTQTDTHTHTPSVVTLFTEHANKRTSYKIAATHRSIDRSFHLFRFGCKPFCYYISLIDALLYRPTVLRATITITITITPRGWKSRLNWRKQYSIPTTLCINTIRTTTLPFELLISDYCRRLFRFLLCIVI